MFPLMPLLLGAVTGAALVRLAQKGRHQHYVHQAKDKLLTATSSSLESLEQASAKLRQKLEPTPTAVGTTDTDPQATTDEQAP
jgi:hypothetical protein